MIFLSFLKSVILTQLDAVNGKFTAFTRPTSPDPLFPGIRNEIWREAIAQSAEKELEDFVVDGVFICEKPNSLGDAAIWQGYYTAMCAIRYDVNPNDENGFKMLEASYALSRYLHGGILHRGAVPTENMEKLSVHQDPSKIYYEVDGVLFRDDASLDSLLGVMLGCAAIQRYGNFECEQLLAPYLKAFSDRFTASGFKIVNRDGKQTTYGNCTPGLFQAPVRILAASLPSLLSGGQEWKKIAGSYNREFRTIDTQVPNKMSWVNAHLAILASLAFMMGTEDGDIGRSEVRKGLETLLSKYSDSGNAMLIFAASALGIVTSSRQLEIGQKVLMEFPLVRKPPITIGTISSLPQPVPIWQHPPCDIVWQRDPYNTTGTEELKYTRLDYLLPHYLSKVVS